MAGTSHRILVLLALLLAVAGGCKPKGESVPQVHKFPGMNIPSAITDPQARLSYAAVHYWDAYFREGAVADTSETEGAMATYLTLLDKVPVAEAQKGVAAFFGKVDAVEPDETRTRLVELVCRYLYDPNSPYRDEDLYLPFAKGMAESPRTPDNVRASFAFDAQRCSLNVFGQKAADFTYRTADGRSHRMYDIKTKYTMMVFTNPGCSACKEIAASMEKYTYIPDMLEKGRLTILNVFVDEDLDSWRANLGKYPDKWINGYDPHLAIREGGIYSLRAIPSIYLLDEDKRVIYKDVPVEKAVQGLLTERK